jgi:hypothetical protein
LEKGTDFADFCKEQIKNQAHSPLSVLAHKHTHQQKRLKEQP